MRRTNERGIKARLSFSGGSHIPVNMADSMEEVNVGRKNPAGNGILGTFAALYCAIFRTKHFRKSLKFFGTAIASLDPETVQLPAFSMPSAMFTEASLWCCARTFCAWLWDSLISQRDFFLHCEVRSVTSSRMLSHVSLLSEKAKGTTGVVPCFSQQMNK